jgi:NAD(P)-dependent dehydrogenase (short-subunit alcohol dehydrogenase family)
MKPTYDFGGQVALVTGASSGMGLATARAFAEHGASVVLADIDEHALGAATDSLTNAGRTALGMTCDVSDEEQVTALVARTASFRVRANNRDRFCGRAVGTGMGWSNPGLAVLEVFSPAGSPQSSPHVLHGSWQAHL